MERRRAEVPVLHRQDSCGGMEREAHLRRSGAKDGSK